MKNLEYDPEYRYKITLDEDGQKRLRLQDRCEVTIDCVELTTNGWLELIVFKDGQEPEKYPMEISNIIRHQKVPRMQQVEPSTSSENSCFIVSACNTDLETLNTYYAFRDQVLSYSSLGQFFIEKYYQYAPKAAILIKKSKIMQITIYKVILQPLATILRLWIDT